MTRQQPSPRVTRLIDQLRKLVAEQRRLEDEARCDGVRTQRVEIARLQRQLANVVRRELDETGAASHA